MPERTLRRLQICMFQDCIWGLIVFLSQLRVVGKLKEA